MGHIVLLDGVCNCLEFGCNDIRPHLHGMQEHGMSADGDHTNVSLNYTILPMSTNTTKQLLLVTFIKMISKGLGCEEAIVAMNVLYVDVIVFDKQFEIFLGFKGGLDCCLFLTMHM